MEVAATGTVKANRMKNDPLRIMVKMKKEKRGSSDVVTDVSSNITAVRWKDNNVVNVISTFPSKQPNQQVKSYCHLEKRRVNIEQPNNTNQYNMSMGGVDSMDLNMVVDTFLEVAVNNAYQIYQQSH